MTMIDLFFFFSGNRFMCCLLHKVAGECHIIFEIERLSLSCFCCTGHPPLKIKHFVVLIFKAERNKLEQL